MIGCVAFGSCLCILLFFRAARSGSTSHQTPKFLALSSSSFSLLSSSATPPTAIRKRDARGEGEEKRRSSNTCAGEKAHLFLPAPALWGLTSPRPLVFSCWFFSSFHLFTKIKLLSQQRTGQQTIYKNRDASSSHIYTHEVIFKQNIEGDEIGRPHRVSSSTKWRNLSHCLTPPLQTDR